MKKLEVGDKVRVFDNSWCIDIGYYNGFHCTQLTRTKNNFVVMETAFLVKKEGYHDIIIQCHDTHKKYLHSSLCVTKVEPVKKIVIDGKEIELSEESYNSLKESLLNQ